MQLKNLFFFSLVLAASAFTMPAQAADDDQVSGGASLLVGPGYWSEDSPNRLRLSIRGEAELATSDAIGFGVVLPVDVASSGSDGFGWETNRTLLEVAPTARLRIAPASPVRAYVDAGAGPWFLFTETDTVFGTAESQRSGFVTTGALGIEIGPTEAESVAVIIEPIRARSYFVDDDDRARAEYSGMVGIGYRF